MLNILWIVFCIVVSLILISICFGVMGAFVEWIVDLFQRNKKASKADRFEWYHVAGLVILVASIGYHVNNFFF